MALLKAGCCSILDVSKVTLLMIINYRRMALFDEFNRGNQILSQSHLITAHRTHSGGLQVPFLSCSIHCVYCVWLSGPFPVRFNKLAYWCLPPLAVIWAAKSEPSYTLVTRMCGCMKNRTDLWPYTINLCDGACTLYMCCVHACTCRCLVIIVQHIHTSLHNEITSVSCFPLTAAIHYHNLVTDHYMLICACSHHTM